MVFDWHEYLTLARQLAETPLDSANEAQWRSSVSRAYYSLFHLAMASAEGFESRGVGDDHVALQKHWQRGKRASIGFWLRDLHQWRRQCDYDDVVENIQDMVKLTLTRADEILAILPAPKTGS